MAASSRVDRAVIERLTVRAGQLQKAQQKLDTYMKDRSIHWSSENKGFLMQMASISALRRSTDFSRLRMASSDYYNRLPKTMGESKTIFTTNSDFEMPAEPLCDPSRARAGLRPEYVVLDCRLENPGLLRFDSSVEVVSIENEENEEDLAYAFPAALDETQLVFSESWRRADDGWIWVPEHALIRYSEQGRLHTGISLSTGWFASLRYHVDASIRNCWNFMAFANTNLRVFLLPLPSEACTRVLVVTHSPLVFNKEIDDHNGDNTRPSWYKEAPPADYQKMQKLVAHYLINPMAGEWRQTGTDDTQEEALALLLQKQTTTAGESTKSTAQTATSSGEGSQEEEEDDDDIQGEQRAPGRAGLRQSGAFFEPPVLDPEEIDDSVSSASASSSSSSSLTDDQTVLPLFPHQRRSVAWMHSREREEQETFEFPQARRFFDRFIYPSGFEKAALVAGSFEILNAQLPRGGCVAHSVGAGKTVIATGLMAQCASLPSDDEQYGTTLVLVPNHIVVQWQREVKRFAPQLQVMAVETRAACREALSRCWMEGQPKPAPTNMLHALIVPFGEFLELQSCLFVGHWTRLIVDEPQEVDFDYCKLRCRFRWALTATPNPLNKVMEAIWGEVIESPFDQVLRAPFIRYCARRDPPGECLPVPPLHVQMVPVTLTWQESSVVQMETMSGLIERSVRLCSYFDRERPGAAQSASSTDKKPEPEPVVSLDDWVGLHRSKYQNEILDLEQRLQRIREIVSRQIAASDVSRSAVRQKNAEKREQLLGELDEERRLSFAALNEQHQQSEELLAVIKALRAELVVADEDEEKAGKKKKKKTKGKSKRPIQLTPEEEEVNILMIIWRKYFCPTGLNEVSGLNLHNETASSSSSSSSSSSASSPSKNKKKREMLLFPHYLPTIPIWEPTNDIEKRIRYLADHIRLQQEFKAKEEEVMSRTGDLSSDEVFAAGDLPGVDDHVVQQLNDMQLRLAQQNRTLAFLATVEKTLRDPNTECAVCFEGLQNEQISLLPCMHAFCVTCVNRLFGTAFEATCPMCRVKAQKRNVSTFICADKVSSETTAASSSSTAASSSSASAIATAVQLYGSKIAVLVSSIQAILATTDDKIIVFGQWQSLLADILKAFEAQNINAELLSARMERRCVQLDTFRNDPAARVLLLSSESQSSGINLDCANHVFIVHPYVPRGVLAAAAVPLLESQAFEKQAVGRVHRYPQAKPVHVYRLYARGSVEEELYTLSGYLV